MLHCENTNVYRYIKLLRLILPDAKLVISIEQLANNFWSCWSDSSPGLRSKVASGSDEAMDSGVDGTTADIKDGQYSEKYVDCLQGIISFLR